MHEEIDPSIHALEEQKSRLGSQGKEGSRSKVSSKESGKRKGPICFSCKGHHPIRDCPTATQKEKRAPRRMSQQRTDKNGASPATTKGSLSSAGDKATTSTPTSKQGASSSKDVYHIADDATHGITLQCRREDDSLGLVCFDSGASVSYVPAPLVKQLTDNGIDVDVRTLDVPINVKYGSDEQMESTNKTARISIFVKCKYGDLTLANLKCYVLDKLDTMLVGDGEMTVMGVSPRPCIYGMGGETYDFGYGEAKVEGVYSLETVDDHGDMDITMSGFHVSDGEISQVVQTAVRSGLAGRAALQQLMDTFRDIWRSAPGPDQPADVPPMIVRTKAGAPSALQCAMRKYSPVHREYLDGHIEELLDHNLVVECPDAQYVSPVFVVPKTEPGSYRMTVDLRAVNSVCEVTTFPLPDIMVVSDRLAGAKLFASLDLFRGFWQMPLSEEASRLFSFMTPRGVFRPLRVPMGSSNSVQYFQKTMMFVLGDLMDKHVIIYIDDILVFAKSEEELLSVLERAFSRCQAHDLKLNIKKNQTCTLPVLPTVAGCFPPRE